MENSELKKAILDHKSISSLGALKDEKKTFRLWNRKLKSSLKGIWGEENLKVIEEISKIPERNASTPAKLREQTKRFEKNFKVQKQRSLLAASHRRRVELIRLLKIMASEFPTSR